MSKRIIIVSNSSSNLINFRGKLIERLIDEKFEVMLSSLTLEEYLSSPLGHRYFDLLMSSLTESIK